MCDVTATYSTVVAPLAELRSIHERWPQLHTVRRYELFDVHMTTLERLAHHWDEHAPAVLTVYHDWVPGHLVADELHIELAVEHGYQVMSEPGYHVGVASIEIGQHGGPEAWDVDLDERFLEEAEQQLGDQEPLGDGVRVAVLDTGGVGSFMLDMVGDEPDITKAVDAEGHGTAIIHLIRALRPKADIRPVRVLRINPGDSVHLLLGLIAVLWPGEDGQARYDVVNVSLSRQLVDECSTSLGATMAFVRALCVRQGVVPPVVAAVGNKTTGQQFGYPAALQGAIAAVALDWEGVTADYNVDVPQGTRAETAYGGTADEPFGTLRRGNDDEPLYGSSFAAALVTCRHLSF